MGAMSKAMGGRADSAWVWEPVGNQAGLGVAGASGARMLGGSLESEQRRATSIPLIG